MIEEIKDTKIKNNIFMIIWLALFILIMSAFLIWYIFWSSTTINSKYYIEWLGLTILLSRIPMISMIIKAKFGISKTEMILYIVFEALVIIVSLLFPLRMIEVI